jgi:hypothetical protein
MNLTDWVTSNKECFYTELTVVVAPYNNGPPTPLAR